MTEEQARRVVKLILSKELPRHWDWIPGLYMRAANVMLPQATPSQVELWTSRLPYWKRRRL